MNKVNLRYVVCVVFCVFMVFWLSAKYRESNATMSFIQKQYHQAYNILTTQPMWNKMGKINC